jgi:hypothetical protein
MIGAGEEHLHASLANLASYVEVPAIGVSSSKKELPSPIHLSVFLNYFFN